MEQRKYDLEDRLVKFAISVLDVCEKLPYKNAISSLTNQLTRSGTAPALIYGEAQAAESRADFIHKIKLILKELRETKICLRIIREKPIIDLRQTDNSFKECNELIGIFSQSVKTAKANVGK